MRYFFSFCTLLLFCPSTPLKSTDIPACMLNYRYGPELHLLLVDKSSHSLTVYSNYASEPVAQFTVTTGKNAGQKQFEGDSKTPEGIYFFTRIISSPNLPKTDDYGEKAFVSDYPNPIDQSEGRKGSGIWLHGAHDPGKTSSPNNSRGCVVMKNEDLTKVSKYIYLNQTPLCIYDRIPYISEQEIVSRRDRFLSRLSSWKQAWENMDTQSYIAHYSNDFTSDGMDLNTFRRHKDQLNRQYRYIRIILDNLSLYSFVNYNVAVFNQLYLSDQNIFNNHKIQYWYNSTQNKTVILAEKSKRLPPSDQIEVDKGNWVTVSQFRNITEKKLLAKQEPKPQHDRQTTSLTFTYPGVQSLKTQNISDTQVEIELAFTEKSDKWRFIPVLSIVRNKQTEYVSLNGIQLREGVPANPEIGTLLISPVHRFSFHLPLDSQPRSLTVFLVDSENQIKQIITSIFTP